MPNDLGLVVAIVGLLLGAVVGYYIRTMVVQKKMQGAEANAEKMLTEAKQKQAELLLEAKEKAMKVVEDAKAEESNRRKELTETQSRLEKRETMFDSKLLEFEDKKTKLEEKTKQVEQVREQVDVLHGEQARKLEEVAGLTKAEAEARLMNIVEENSKEAIASRIRKLEQAGEDEVQEKARDVLSLAVMRMAASVVVDSSTTMVELPSDEMKGRIIGKEGRNIKALEHQTGTEIIVDDTPGSIMISGFSPIRRQVCKRALESLIADGRIHPARIEEAVAEAKKNLAVEIKKAGEEALYTLGIPVSSIDPKLTSILGRMKFRTSYGQNALQHSIEVATLAGMIAEELGADAFACKKGGLFHDIGKAVDHDMQGAHPEIGYNILKKFGFPEDLCYQSIAHHEDKPRTLEGTVVKAADAISGARPGARKNSLEQYIQRLEELEATATSFPGVEKAYAIQAGREIRVFVEPQAMDDYGSFQLAKNIAQKIESELQYPGEIKVTVIRETRVVEYAR
ncbi:MAG: ribonuclease Y [Patescibacteria group bacterium]